MGVAFSSLIHATNVNAPTSSSSSHAPSQRSSLPSFFPATYAAPTMARSDESSGAAAVAPMMSPRSLERERADLLHQTAASGDDTAAGTGLLRDDVLHDEKLTLQICIAGVKAAMAEGKLERAAMFLAKHFDLAEKRDAAAVDADASFFQNLAAVEVEVLDHEAARVRDELSQRLADAVARGNAGETLRLCRLFAPLRYTEEGLLDYYHHLQQRFVSQADAIFTRLAQQQQQQQAPPKDDVVFKQLTDDGDVVDGGGGGGGGGGDDDSRLSCSDALTELFECVALIMDEQRSLFLIDTLFGAGSERFVIGNLQAQCDKWSSRIYQYFLQQIDLARILQRIHASSRDAEQRADAVERLDPRVLTDLLEELALMSRCTEFYHRFVRQRAASASLADGSSAPLAPLAMAADAYLQEIRSYYVAFEEYFLAESVTRAIAMGREEALPSDVQLRGSGGVDGDESTAAVSVVVEYVFFVLQHCTRRALLSASVRNVCQVLYLLNNALELEYKKCLQDGWLESLRHFRRLQAIGASKLTVVANDAAQHFDQCIVIANDVDESSEYIARLRDEAHAHVRTVFTDDDNAVSKSDSERLALCIQDLTNAANSFATLADQCIATLFDSVLPRVEQLTAELTSAAGAAGAQQAKRSASASAAATPDEYVLPLGALESASNASVVAGQLLRSLIELVLVQHGRGFTPRNADRLCVRLARHLGDWLCDRATVHAFSLAGGVFFSREVSEVVRVLSRRCKTQAKALAVVAAMSRAQAAAEILSCANAADALDYFEEGLVSSLDARFVANLVARRVDFGDAADAVRRQLLDAADGKPRAPRPVATPPAAATRPQPASARASSSHQPMGAALFSTPPPRRLRSADNNNNDDDDDGAAAHAAHALPSTPDARLQLQRVAAQAPMSAPPRSSESHSGATLTPLKLDFDAPAPAAAGAGGAAAPWWATLSQAPE
jgi:hypothetical protein